MTMYDQSLMVPVERQAKSAGGAVFKQVLKAISKPKTAKAKTITAELKEKYTPSEIEEMAESFVEAVENNTKITSKGTVSLKTSLSNIAQETADTLNKNKDVTKNFIDAKDIIKISRLDDLRAGGGGKTDSLLDSIIQSVGSVTEKPSVMGSFIPEEAAGTRPVRKSQVFAGATGVVAGSLLSGGAMSAWNMLNDEPPATKKEASDFEKAFSAAFKAGKDTFEFDGKQYTTELKREAKSAGGILAKKILSFAGAKASKDAPKVTAKRKAALADEEADRAAEMLEDALMQDPEFLDNMDPDDLEALMADLPPAYRSKLSPDMGDVQEDTLELLRGMDPSDVADNLQLFNSLGELKTYTKGLNPKETREFITNVSPDDYDMFEGFQGLIQELGPRQVKAHGGAIGLLVPVEGLKPDGEMEDDYVSHVMDKTLSEKEVDYVNEALEKDDELSKIVDKLVLASSEFRGSGEVEGPGTGTSDEIPARLSDGEFVFTKKAVDVIGVEKLEKMMKDAEEQAERQNKALGGIVDTPLEDEKATMTTESGNNGLIEEQMLKANRMPSLMR